MLTLYNLVLVAGHIGYYAILDFIVEVGDHYVTHLIAIYRSCGQCSNQTA